MDSASASLIEHVIDAHGGLERWRTFDHLTASVVAGGALWSMKGTEIGAAPRTIRGRLRKQRVDIKPFGDPDWRMTYTPKRIVIKAQGGSRIVEQEHPRQAFAGHAWSTPWGPVHLAYFNGYAMWTYFNLPFVLAEPGFEVAEIAPITQERASLKGLRVHFPKNVHSHSATQDLYFDAQGLLRRQDYDVDVAGGVAAAHLISDYIDVQGLRVATKRRVFLRNQDRTLRREQVIVSIDLSKCRFD